MPNWVYNTLDNYNEELYNKYKADDGSTDIDFNKIIPEPEEVTTTPSCSFNGTAKNVYKYNQYRKELKGDKEHIQSALKFSRANPLYKEVTNYADNAIHKIGALAIENPDKSLNQILKEDDHKISKDLYDSYIDIFGNSTYLNCKDYDRAYSKYIEQTDRRFANFKESSKNTKYNDDGIDYDKYKDLNDFGKQLIELKEKYGYDNWYDWRCANWGTKWNSCDTDYDKENHSLRFDTPWSIPYPIIAKIAEENPDVELEGYSEEESGWFEEYCTNKGKVLINARGKLVWDEDGNGDTVENKEFLNPPEEFSFEDFKKRVSELPWNSD